MAPEFQHEIPGTTYVLYSMGGRNFVLTDEATSGIGFFFDAEAVEALAIAATLAAQNETVLEQIARERAEMFRSDELERLTSALMAMRDARARVPERDAA